MSYIVLGLGMLLSAIGAYAMYSGFRIIEIERGWATAISGSVLFAGGIVTIAVGLILRALARLQSSLVGDAGAATGAARTQPIDHPAITETPQVLGGDIATPPSETSPDSKEIHGSGGEGVAAEGSAPREFNAPIDTLLTEVDVLGSSRFEESPARDHRGWPVENDDHHEPLARSDLRAVEPEPLHQEPGGAEPADAPAAIDDWLDQSFADMGDVNVRNDDHPPVEGADRASPIPPEEPPQPLDDLAQASASPRTKRPLPTTDTEGPEPTGPSEASAPTVGETAAVSETTVHEARTVNEATTVDEAAMSESTGPAVIGRYESEGTSYVMYADGSIEAQSEAGVYRFASMAELKAFIEG